MKNTYFTKIEFALWAFSILFITLSFFLAKNTTYFYLVASIVGATALIFVSKGNVIGQILTIVFAILYGIISYKYKYFGEMVTYLGMSAPIAFIAVFTWLKNPFEGKKSEVKVNTLGNKEFLFLLFLAIIVSIIFYYILSALNTANIIISTVSVFTSFTASYLTMRRSPLYALAYAVNDVVLIVMWVFATLDEINYLSMVICFIVFFINDLYGFYNWIKLKKMQSAI